MNTQKWLYIKNKDNTFRYVLGEKGERTIACIGINPSTAIPDALDNTLKSVKRIAAHNGYDGWMMFNVYPQRATNPKNIAQTIDHKERLTNIGAIRRTIQELGIDTIWVAYGNLIECRPFLQYCLADLYHKLSNLDLKWILIESPTKKGHPKHPLYRKSENPFIDFDMEKYINEHMKSNSCDFDKVMLDGFELK